MTDNAHSVEPDKDSLASQIVYLSLQRQGSFFAKEMQLRYAWLTTVATVTASFKPLKKALRPLKQALPRKQGRVL